MRADYRRTARLARLTTMLVALCAAARLVGAQNPHAGIRMGYNFDTRDPVISTNLTLPITNRVEFYPSLDVYLPDRGSMTGLNGDVKVRVPTIGGPDLYFGGGLGVLSRNVGAFSNTDVGVNAIMGVESRQGSVHPFFEGRVLLHDNSTFQAIGGLNFTLGGRR